MSFVQILRNMGCCYSCKEDSSVQGGEANERTHLLVDPVSNSAAIQRVHSDEFLTRYPNSLPKKTDEQSALNRILQETATNVIDVSALGPHALEQHEFLERVKLYAQRLQQVQLSSASTGRRGVGAGNIQQIAQPILADVPAPERWLAAHPLDARDLALVVGVAERAGAALADLRVEHREDLVVPFVIP